MASIRKPSRREMNLSRKVKRTRRTAERTSMTRSRSWKLSGVMVPKMTIGMPMTIQILKILLPMILPTMRSVSLWRAATMVVTSSGREVPRAMMVRAMMRSEIPIPWAISEALFTTSWLPATRQTRPMRARRKDLPSLYLGFSRFLVFASRFLKAMATR